jgi:hypothetical protein
MNFGKIIDIDYLLLPLIRMLERGLLSRGGWNSWWSKISESLPRCDRMWIPEMDALTPSALEEALAWREKEL